MPGSCIQLQAAIEFAGRLRALMAQNIGRHLICAGVLAQIPHHRKMAHQVAVECGADLARDTLGQLVAELRRVAVAVADSGEQEVIPTRLNFDFCPFTFSDGTDEIGPIGDGVPGVTASIEDGLIGFPDLMTEGVAA